MLGLGSVILYLCIARFNYKHKIMRVDTIVQQAAARDGTYDVIAVGKDPPTLEKVSNLPLHGETPPHREKGEPIGISRIRHDTTD